MFFEAIHIEVTYDNNIIFRKNNKFVIQKLCSLDVKVTWKVTANFSVTIMFYAKVMGTRVLGRNRHGHGQPWHRDRDIFKNISNEIYTVTVNETVTQFQGGYIILVLY